MRRITVSLSTKNEDAKTVRHALEAAPHWKRSRELLRWAAAYLNGEVLDRDAPPPLPAIDEDEIDALMDEF